MVIWGPRRGCCAGARLHRSQPSMIIIFNILIRFFSLSIMQIALMQNNSSENIIIKQTSENGNDVACRDIYAEITVPIQPTLVSPSVRLRVIIQFLLSSTCFTSVFSATWNFIESIVVLNMKTNLIKHSTWFCNLFAVLEMKFTPFAELVQSFMLLHHESWKVFVKYVKTFRWATNLVDFSVQHCLQCFKKLQLIFN